MAEDKKNKPGLHKKISSIFEGVPLPQPGSLQPPPAGPPPELSGEGGRIPQKPLPPPYQTLRAAQPPRPFEAGRPAPQAAPVSQPKAGPKAAVPILWQKIKEKLLVIKPGVSATKQKVMLVLVPVLLAVLIFAATSVLVPPRKLTKPPQGKLPTTAVSAETQIDWEIPPPYPETLRDPMQPIPSAIIPGKTEPEKPEPVKKEEKPVVKGILYSEDNPSAIIGTQIVHEGDKVSGATIIKINKDNVEFEKDGEKWNQGVEP
jgi:hypothetical protein